MRGMVSICICFRYDNNVARSNQRPTLAVIGGLLHMVYVGTDGSSLWWSWFDGTKWGGNVEIGSATAVNSAVATIGECGSPSMVSMNGQLYLAYHSYSEDPHDTTGSTPVPDGRGGFLPEGGHSYVLCWSTVDVTKTLEAKNWSPGKVIKGQFRQPALAISNGKIILAASGGDSSVIYANVINFAANPFNNHAWLPLELQNGAVVPKSKQGVDFATLGSTLYMAFPGEGGSNMYYASLDDSMNVFGNIQIKCTNAVPITSAPIGVVAFGNQLALAYKGNDSDNMWFTYASPK